MTSVIPQMMASRIHEFGPPEVIVFERIARIGTVLPHAEARRAHQMLERMLPRARGKIVLRVGE
jgi:hypothetical protein